MIDLLSGTTPGILLIFVGLIGCLIDHQRLRQLLMVATPVAGLAMLSLADRGVDIAGWSVLGLDLVLYRVDGLSFIFALAFMLASLVNSIFALHSDDRIHDGMALIYAGAAIAATLTGDLMSLFIFWEITALSSVFMILRAGTQASYNAAMRYLGIQILSGVLLLSGLVYVYGGTGTLSLDVLTGFETPGALLIFAAIGIKAAFPLLHNWLQDAYPKASVVGAVVLSAFTTKLAVYALARLFPGQPELIWIGAIMTVFPVFFAVIENDLRRVLAFSINNQVGFMVCGVGIGTPLALNGVAAHAFADIFFKGLLFMTMGAVLYRTGTTKASELGGLYKSMPWTTVFCVVGAMSISAFPLFSAFVTKSMIIGAVALGGHTVIWLMLMFASAGVLEHSGIKIPYYAFFGHDSGRRVKEAPFNMLLAMGISAVISIAIGLPTIGGLGYGWLYAMLPCTATVAVDVCSLSGEAIKVYQPFTFEHILTQMQLLMFAILAFVLLKKFKLYPAEKPGTIIDIDWFYRRPAYNLLVWTGRIWGKLGPALTMISGRLAVQLYGWLEEAFSPRGALARGWLINSMAVWSAVLLAVVMVVAFFAS